MKGNVQTLHVDPCRCGALSHHFQGVGSLGNSFTKLKARAPKALKQQWMSRTSHLDQKGRRVPGEPHLGAAGRARGQPGLSSLLPVARPRALRGGCHSPATPATWMRTKPNRRARAMAAWEQGTRGPLGVAMSPS